MTGTRPEVFARATTPHGEIALRRRDGVVELIVNGAFAMDSAEVTSEHALADAAGPAPGDGRPAPARRHPPPSPRESRPCR